MSFFIDLYDNKRAPCRSGDAGHDELVPGGAAATRATEGPEGREGKYLVNCESDDESIQQNHPYFIVIVLCVHFCREI